LGIRSQSEEAIRSSPEKQKAKQRLAKVNSLIQAKKIKLLSSEAKQKRMKASAEAKK